MVRTRHVLAKMGVVVFALTAAAAVGCGGSDSGSTGTSGSGSTSGSSGTSGSGGTTGGVSQLCSNPPQNTAAQITKDFSASPMPASGTAQGGTLVSGTYSMTAITYYGQASGSGTQQDTLVLDASAKTFVVSEINGGTSKPTVAGSYALSNQVMNQSLACPAVTNASVEYTSDGASTLTFYSYDANSVSTWTKQ